MAKEIGFLEVYDRDYVGRTDVDIFTCPADKIVKIEFTRAIFNNYNNQLKLYQYDSDGEVVSNLIYNSLAVGCVGFFDGCVQYYTSSYPTNIMGADPLSPTATALVRWNSANTGGDVITRPFRITLLPGHKLTISGQNTFVKDQAFKVNAILYYEDITVVGE